MAFALLKINVFVSIARFGRYNPPPQLHAKNTAVLKILLLVYTFSYRLSTVYNQYVPHIIG